MHNSLLYLLLQNMFQEKLFKEDVFHLLGDRLNSYWLLSITHQTSSGKGCGLQQYS